jgi:hypothetical protein
LSWAFFIKGLAKSLPFILDREIDQRGGAAKGRSNCAGLEIVGAGSSPEGHVQVGMHVDAPGDYEKSRGVNDLACVLDRELCGYGGDLVAVNADVGGEGV